VDQVFLVKKKKQVSKKKCGPLRAEICSKFAAGQGPMVSYRKEFPAV
jgi:hypothetical protein